MQHRCAGIWIWYQVSPIGGLRKGCHLRAGFRTTNRSCAKNRICAKKNLPANLFLPLFKQQPDWEALGFLNGDSPEVQPSFRSHLFSWYLRAPAQHRAFLRKALQMFGWDAP